MALGRRFWVGSGAMVAVQPQTRWVGSLVGSEWGRHSHGLCLNYNALRGVCVCPRREGRQGCGDHRSVGTAIVYGGSRWVHTLLPCAHACTVPPLGLALCLENPL